MASFLVLSKGRADAAVLALVLEFGGHQCEVASTIKEASELLERGAFDGVVVEHLRNDFLLKPPKRLESLFRKTTVLFLTNNPEQVQQCATGIVLKAGPTEQLLQAIDTIMRRKTVVSLRTSAHAAAKAKSA